MTAKNAYETVVAVRRILDGELVIDDPGFKVSTLDMLDLAKTALQRQIPVEAIMQYDDIGRDRICPICDNQVGGKPYCAWCGQRIAN